MGANTLSHYGIKPISFDDTLAEMEEDQKESSFTTAYRLSGEAKVTGTIEFTETLLKAGVKFLLFAHHKNVLDEYEKFYVKKKVKCIRIDGRVNPEKRHQMVTEFQHDDTMRIALLSINACSQGLTLTAALTVVFAEMTWTPSIMTQAEDRAHRISQQNCVNVYYLYGPGTVDDIVFRMIDFKSEVVNETLDGTAQNFQVSRKSKNDALDEVKKAHKEGDTKPSDRQQKEDQNLDDFFGSSNSRDSFVKREPETNKITHS
jgi:SWI/SNF-related matrix-associated actin-dependent regulator 1 of chromatin subfamily A